MIARIKTVWLTAAWVLVSTASLPGQESLEAVEIKPVKVADGIYMLEGRGGNMEVSVGDDAVFLVDDQFAPLTDRILAAVRKITPRPVGFVLNTHWHGDHTGGNENLGEAGVLIVAHENVRVRLSSEQFIKFFNRSYPPSPEKALPGVTFNDRVTFHLNGEEIRAFHVAPAHTDGDSVVHFRTSNVVHMGDLFFNGLYPFIDVSSGGSINGVIAAANRVLEMMDSQTKVIPGHGPLGNRSDLQNYRDLLVTVRDRIQPMVEAGKSLEEVMASKPTREFDAAWGEGFIGADDFVSIVYDSLKSSK